MHDTSIQVADDLYAKGKLAVARAAYRAALWKAPCEPLSGPEQQKFWLAFDQVRGNLILGRFASAFDISRRIVAASRSQQTVDWLLATLGTGQAAGNPVDRRARLKALRVYLAKGADPAWARLTMACLHRQGKDMRGALRAAAPLAKLRKEHQWMRYVTGNLLSEFGHGAAAEAEYAACVEDAPELWKAHIYLVMSGGASSRRSLKLFHACLERLQGTSRTEALCWRGLLNMKKGALALALKDIDEGLGVTTDFGLAHAWRGRVLSKLKRDDEAVAAFDEALRRDPGLGKVFLWRARARLSQGRLDLCRADLACGHRLAPDENEFFSVRAELRLEEARRRAAGRAASGRRISS